MRFVSWNWPIFRMEVDKGGSLTVGFNLDIKCPFTAIGGANKWRFHCSKLSLKFPLFFLLNAELKLQIST